MRTTVFLLLLAWSSTAVGQDLVLRNATLIDGTAAPPRENVAIVVNDGRVVVDRLYPTPY